jgi:rhomboid protease GluP
LSTCWASAPATYVLLGINCAVYLAMCLRGVSPVSPTAQQVLNWGGDFGPAVLLGGQWWRLISAAFVHIGLLHLATNMWCLWNLGLLGEPLVGAGGMVAAYLITGAAGNLLSVALHPGLRADGADAIVGAGASGAIFGLAGVLIVLLSSKLLPLPLVERNQLRKSVLWFAVLNFVLAAGVDLSHFSLKVDNGAHFGGFVAGLLMALLMVPRIGAPPELFRRRRNLAVLAAVFALGLLSYAVHSYFLTGRLS